MRENPLKVSVPELVFTAPGSFASFGRPEVNLPAHAIGVASRLMSMQKTRFQASRHVIEFAQRTWEALSTLE